MLVLFHGSDPTQSCHGQVSTQLSKGVGLSRVFFCGLAISPSEICSAPCGPNPGYLYSRSAEIIVVEGRQSRREKCGKRMISPFLLTELSLLWSHFPWELQSGGSAVLGTHLCHPLSVPKSRWCSCEESLCPKYMESPTYFL